jgi:hypothetical protein
MSLLERLFTVIHKLSPTQMEQVRRVCTCMCVYVCLCVSPLQEEPLLFLAHTRTHTHSLSPPARLVPSSQLLREDDSVVAHRLLTRKMFEDVKSAVFQVGTTGEKILKTCTEDPENTHVHTLSHTLMHTCIPPCPKPSPLC